MQIRDPHHDPHWLEFRELWNVREDSVYLNHGSFGPTPRPVLAAQQGFTEQLARQPMDFFIRRHVPAWHAARARLAAFLGSRPENLTLVANATYGMNVVAGSFPLAAGDEVLLTDHEYGAVRRIWQRRTAECGAALRTVNLPFPMTTEAKCVAAITAALTPRTRLLVVSHITSPTALVLPVRAIVEAVRPHDAAVCIDGPHAVAQLPLALDELDADYYTASCHKWLSAPLGSGFLHVAPRRQAEIRPPILSWERTVAGPITEWSEEFLWSGTHDPAAALAIPAAIDLLEQVGCEAFRARSHALAAYARKRLGELACGEPPCPDSTTWYAGMALMPLPPGDARTLQTALWRDYGIEVPIIEFAGGRFIRVSAHLYNTRAEIDLLVEALKRELARS